MIGGVYVLYTNTEMNELNNAALNVLQTDLAELPAIVEKPKTYYYHCAPYQRYSCVWHSF